MMNRNETIARLLAQAYNLSADGSEETEAFGVKIHTLLRDFNVKFYSHINGKYNK